MKKCGHCKQILTLENFSKHKNRKDGFHNQCKNCNKEYRKEHKGEIAEAQKIYHEKYRDEIIKAQKKYRDNHVKELKEYRIKNKHRSRELQQKWNNSLKGRDVNSNRKFGISISDMLEWQDYKCAICGVGENGRKLHVDHDHKNGQIRMLLCIGCNSGTGIKDDAILCFAKGSYLEAYQ
jgi:hypothetical protein